MKIQDISRFDKILIVATVLLLIAMYLWYNKDRYHQLRGGSYEILDLNTGEIFVGWGKGHPVKSAIQD